MSAVKEIEGAIQKLSHEEMVAVHDWLQNLLEDQLEMTAEFKASIEKGRKELKEGKGRIHKAGSDY